MNGDVKFISEIRKLCRTCLAEKNDEDLQPLFENSLHILLYELTCILIEKDDRYPTCICSNCLFSLNVAVNFKQQCKRSDDNLREAFAANHTVPEIEKSNIEKEVLEAEGTINIILANETRESIQENIASSIEKYSITENGLNNINVPIENDISKNKRTDEKISYKCEECNKIFHSHCHLIKHGKNIKCEVNNMINMSIPTKVHKRSHTGEKPMVCATCGKRFSGPHGLARHNKIHTGERKFECDICGKKFVHSFVLTAHKRVHTGERPYKCKTCGASYATSSYLTIHQRIHTQEKPYPCSSCPKKFISRCSLVAHLKIHSGEKKFQCNICGKRFGRSADLQVHMRSHTGEKPYTCNLCPKKYHTSSNLAAHKRTHSGIKEHVCSICDKAFGDSRTLKSHCRTHTGERPYLCTVCGVRYTQPGQLSAHRRTHID